MFTPEQLVVYPTQGVGRVLRIEHKNVGGQEVAFYIIEIVTNNVTAMVPVANATAVGLRTLCTPAEAAGVLTSFEDRTGFTGYTGQNWNRRYREYTERLKSAALVDVCYVVKDLLLISGEKDLSFGERRLLEQAMGLVASELSMVLERPVDTVKADIEAYFADILEKKEKPLPTA